MENIFGTDDFKSKTKALKQTEIKEKKKNISIAFYADDVDLMDRVIDHLVFEERIRKANISYVFTEGMELLKKKYGVLKEMEDELPFRGGKRVKDYEVKYSSIHMTAENAKYFKNFMYLQTVIKKNREYFNHDFTREVIRLVADKYGINYEQ